MSIVLYTPDNAVIALHERLEELRDSSPSAEVDHQIDQISRFLEDMGSAEGDPDMMSALMRTTFMDALLTHTL
jgi:hypothetical protein